MEELILIQGLVPFYTLRYLQWHSLIGYFYIHLDKQQRMRVPNNIFHDQQTDNSAGLFEMIHSKFTKLGHGSHGAPIHRFRYHMDDAKWISIEPIAMGKVVGSNTCPEVKSLFFVYTY